MSLRSIIFLSLLFFSFICSFKGYTLEYLQEELQAYSKSNNLLQPDKSNKAKRYSVMYSDEQKFAWFLVYKVASTTLKSFFKTQVYDLTRSKLSESMPKKFKSYYKFAFVRNPWDRIVSCYFQKVVTKKHQPFKECFDKDFDYFIDYISKLDVNHAKTNPHIRSQTKLIPVDQCDFIGKLEHFTEDLKYICDVIGLEMIVLPHRNKSEHKHYSTYYTSRTQQIIANKYKEDIETFGFIFETE